MNRHADLTVVVCLQKSSQGKHHPHLRATDLLGNAISTSERLVSLIKHLASSSQMNGYHFWLGAKGSGPKNLPINDPNFENWGDKESKRWCRLQEKWCHWKVAEGYVKLAAILR